MAGSADLRCELLKTLIRRGSTAGPIPRSIILQFTPIADDQEKEAASALDSISEEPFIHQGEDGLQVDVSKDSLLDYTRQNCSELLILIRRVN